MPRILRCLEVLSLSTLRWMALALATCLASGDARADEEEGWPREIAIDSAEVVVYQPQLESFEENRLRGRAVVSVRMLNAENPVFGTAWLEARVDTDFDERVVTLRSLQVPRVRFPGASEAEQVTLASLLEEQIPAWEMSLSLDRLLAGMEEIEQRLEASHEFNDAAPAIRFVDSPTVLVSIDGAPKWWPISDTRLQSVANSAFFIVQEQSGGALYLYAGSDTWYSAKDLEGPWRVAPSVPQAVREQAPEEPELEQDEEPEEEDAVPQDDTPPVIVVATEPTELVVTTGKPNYKPLENGQLLYIENTDSDVILEVETQRHFVLLSGRWFAAKSLEGPWTYVAADALPESFAQIPEDSDMGHVLAWVAGTEMAREVALDAYVPQTTALRRDATIEVTYDGEPEFSDVETTTLKYAVNSQYQVIQAGTTYYCAYEAAWYVAKSPTGPWQVATEVPDEIRNIPASSPVYNTKYVYVFESTPEVVYVGYYPGYTHCYYYHGCVVYGTGWYYRPYWRRGCYYPRHSTWGFHVRYNPWTGWSFGLSWSNGPFTFSIGRGGVHGWFGPAWRHSYRRGYRRGYHRGWQQGFRQGARAGYAAGKRSNNRNIYSHKANRARNAPQANRARGGTARPGGGTQRPGGASPGAGNRGGQAPGASNRAAVQPKTSNNRANNLYSDRDGNVHRKNNDGSWQSRENGSWKSTDRSGGDRSTGSRPSTGQTPQTRPSTRQPQSRQQSLDRSAQSRQRGTQRSQASRGSTRARGGGGRGRR